MYVKPEVTRYSGAELVDLMGPVETAYDCNLEVTQDGCDIVFTLDLPNGMTVGDMEDWKGFGFVLDSPNHECADNEEGFCPPDNTFCPFEDPGEDPGDTSLELRLLNVCEDPPDCQKNGTWYMEAWWVDGSGKDGEPCYAEVQFED
jgi:hypothetical protein